MRTVLVMAAGLALGACAQEGPGNEASITGRAKSLIEERRANAQAAVGRYQYHPGAYGLPALILDTSNGCVELLTAQPGSATQAPVLKRTVSTGTIAGMSRRCNGKSR